MNKLQMQSNRPFLPARLILAAILIVLAGAVYLILENSLLVVFRTTQPLAILLIAGLLIFLIALMLSYLWRYAGITLDEMLAPKKLPPPELVDNFCYELSGLEDLQSILNRVTEQINSVFRPSIIQIFIFDQQERVYLTPSQIPGDVNPNLSFSTNSALIEHLTHNNLPLRITEPDALPPNVKADAACLALLGVQVVIPFPGAHNLSGWLAMGRRPGSQDYSPQELAEAQSLCNQASLAIERAQMVTHLENKVQELNVLTRIVRKVNITLELEDILELIYSKTNDLFANSDFDLLLWDASTWSLKWLYSIENGIRQLDRENKALPPGQGLEQEIIQKRHALLTDHYASFCEEKGVKPSTTGVYAWMGVPLNTGVETIGTLSVGSRDPALSYTPDQLNLFQAIADETTGAILKGRLLQETKQYARQMATVNELTRQLTTTLDLELLLQNILSSAEGILNCEAGSLLLADEDTGELVFRVVTGPVAKDLFEKRIPAGSGIAGKCFTTRQAVTINDVQTTPEWFKVTDHQTGFVTRALLVTPLEVKDKVIGVLEVINKKDGSPFTQNDLSLLGAFAGQAAIAIENSRLYTMTDQLLTKRIEELSILQRIDRDLNTTLDLAQTMQITVDWAVKLSESQTGLIAIHEDNNLRVIASAGYLDVPANLPEAILPANPLFQSVLLSGEIQTRLINPDEDDSYRLNEACSQVVIPIRHEAKTIAVLLLEREDPLPYPEEIVDFLVRLCDHAAIAITNAMLYAAVQEASLAKNRFISLVSHKLINPLSTVIECSNRLITEEEGPITLKQSQSLQTIRTNAEKMSTLMSDLSDF